MAREPDEITDIFLTAVTAQEPEPIFALLNDTEIDFGCRPALRRAPDGSYQLDLFATEQKIKELREVSGLDVTVVHNASAEGRKRQREVGKGDRFDGGKVAPRGLGSITRPDIPRESY